MKKFKILSFILAMSVLLVGCAKGEKGKTEKDKDDKKAGYTYNHVEDYRKSKKPFLSVNGKEIPYEKFYKFFDLYSSIVAVNQNLSSQVTNLFVMDTIINEELEKDKVKVDDKELEKEISDYKKRLGGDSEYYKYISVLGVTEDMFKENILNSLKNKKHQELFIKNLKFTDKELKEYYDKSKDAIDNVEAKHILTKDEETANKAIKRLKAGEDFAKVAKELSTDTAANSQGGDLGKVTKQGFDPNFVEAAFKLKEKEISKPVKTQFGYHVILVYKNNVGFEKNKESIKERLGKEKYQQEMQKKVQLAKVKLFEIDGKEINSQANAPR